MQLSESFIVRFGVTLIDRAGVEPGTTVADDETCATYVLTDGGWLPATSPFPGSDGLEHDVAAAGIVATLRSLRPPHRSLTQERTDDGPRADATMIDDYPLCSPAGTDKLISVGAVISGPSVTSLHNEIEARA